MGQDAQYQIGLRKSWEAAAVSAQLRVLYSSEDHILRSVKAHSEFHNWLQKQQQQQQTKKMPSVII